MSMPVWCVLFSRLHHPHWTRMSAQRLGPVKPVLIHDMIIKDSDPWMILEAWSLNVWTLRRVLCIELETLTLNLILPRASGYWVHELWSIASAKLQYNRPGALRGCAWCVVYQKGEIQVAIANLNQPCLSKTEDQLLLTWNRQPKRIHLPCTRFPSDLVLVKGNLITAV
jgi:hypothetical protein